MFITALVHALGIIDHSLSIVDEMVKSASPENKAAIMERHEERMKPYVEIVGWVREQIAKHADGK